MIGDPAKCLTFFRGMRLLPPRAGMMAIALLVVSLDISALLDEMAVRIQQDFSSKNHVVLSQDGCICCHKKP